MALLIRGGGMRTSLHLPCAPPIPRAFSFRLPFFSYHQIHHHLDLSIPPFSNPDIDFFLLKKQTLRRRSIAPILAMGYEKELSVAKKAALLAAQLCKKVQKSLLQSDVQSKTDKSPVTIADYEEDSSDLRKDSAQEVLARITNLVNETLCNDGSYGVSPLTTEGVLASIDKGKSEGGPHGRHWVLDPIDGTKGFLRGDQYAIALALLEEGKVVLGVLACPNLPLSTIGSDGQLSYENGVGCLFSASVGSGTEVQSLDNSGTKKVKVCPIEDPAEASFFESFEAAHSMQDLTGSIAEKLGVQAPPVRIDSQAKYGALARGDGAIYLRFAHQGYREKIWDHAAGSIVVTEAGGVVTDAAGSPLDFSRGRYLDLDTGIIATNRKLMPLLLHAVQAAMKEKAASKSSL